MPTIRMSSQGRRLDHWSASLDAVEELRRLVSAPDGLDDPVTRQLMAQVAHVKSSSFIALLDGGGHVLDVNPAALIAGGVDRAEVIGLPLGATSWWSGADREEVDRLERAIAAAGDGRFARFDVDVKIEAAGREIGTLDLLLRPLRGRDGRVAFIV